MKNGVRDLQGDEPEIVDGYRELDVEGKALVLATVRKLAKDVEVRMLAAGFIKMALTPEEFKLIMYYRAANAEGKARIMAAAEAAPKRREAELLVEKAKAALPKPPVSGSRPSAGKAPVPQEADTTGVLPDAFFAAAKKQREET